MKLVSSKDALDFLSQAAPRAWANRLLRWMAFDEGLTAYSRKGMVQGYTSVSTMTAQLLDKAGQLSGPRMDEAIREEFTKETADKLVSKDPFSTFDDEPFTWDESEEPKSLDIGFFLYADEIDWDKGTLVADYIPGHGELSEVFFSDSEFLGTELDRPDFRACIEGLSFEFHKIEMLLPTMQLGQTTGFLANQHDNRRPVGRPPKWDWEGAMAFVISQAQHPDGLPTGPGAQARIETLISDWFVRHHQDAPSPSQVRQRAAKIMQMLEMPEIR
jgi:hypothetical protein